MTWHDRGQERQTPPPCRDLLVFCLFYAPSLYWLLSVGLAR